MLKENPNKTTNEFGFPRRRAIDTKDKIIHLKLHHIIMYLSVDGVLRKYCNSRVHACTLPPNKQHHCNAMHRLFRHTFTYHTRRAQQQLFGMWNRNRQKVSQPMVNRYNLRVIIHLRELLNFSAFEAFLGFLFAKKTKKKLR